MEHLAPHDVRLPVTLATAALSPQHTSEILVQTNEIRWDVDSSTGDVWSRPRWEQNEAPAQSWDLGSTGKGILIGMLSAFGTAALVAFVVAIFYFFRFTSPGRILLDRFSRPGEFDDEQQFLREEEDALAEMDDLQRAEYTRAKAFVQANPPESIQTDISLSQFLAIQEKGVSAWEFEPELEIANCFVEARTEIEFFDSECSVQSNLPIPKQNEVYYWEAKIYDKPETTTLSIGVTTKPYPLFRMPGFHKCSLAYLSSGHRRFNQPFAATPYGPPMAQGDVVGVGYRPRTGAIFFTRNGKKLDEVAHGLKMPNFFPTVGANGPATVHVNFGQMGFVFIEANVKKWGLAPMTGSLAPPPPYGSEAGSILLESGRDGVREGASAWLPGHGRTNSNHARLLQGRPMRSPNGPNRSPTDISLAQLNLLDYADAGEDAPSPSQPQQSSRKQLQDPGEGRSFPPPSSSYFSPPPRTSSQGYARHSGQYSESNSPSDGRVDLPRNQPFNSRGEHNGQEDEHFAQLPPPEYESPEDSLDDDDDDEGDESGRNALDPDATPRANAAFPPPRQSRQQRRQEARRQRRRQADDDQRPLLSRNDSPPIPTYEAAVGERID